MATQPAPAAHRDAASEQAAALVEKHRHRHSDWLVAFLFGNMYERQVNAGDAVYDFTVDHSQRMVDEFSKLRIGSSSVEGAASVVSVRKPSPKKPSLAALPAVKVKKSLGVKKTLGAAPKAKKTLGVGAPVLKKILGDEQPLVQKKVKKTFG